jgi:uncharacterized protein (DUF1501 family)
MTMRPLNRRLFLSSACAGGLATTFAPGISFAQAPTDKRFVFVLLRGAMDGLHALVPYGDPAYAGVRGPLAYDAGALSRLDQTFGLAPGLAALKPAFDAGELLPLHGLAIPYRTRSHFDAQSILETGLDKPIGADSGWLNRTMEVLGGTQGLGIAVGNGLPLSLRGAAPVATWAPQRAGDRDEAFYADLAQLYSRDSHLADSFTAALNLQAQAGVSGMAMSRQGLGQFQQLFQATGRFLKTEEGPRIAALEFSGWDTHAGQGLPPWPRACWRSRPSWARWPGKKPWLSWQPSLAARSTPMATAAPIMAPAGLRSCSVGPSGAGVSWRTGPGWRRTSFTRAATCVQRWIPGKCSRAFWPSTLIFLTAC